MRHGDRDEETQKDKDRQTRQKEEQGGSTKAQKHNLKVSRNTVTQYLYFVTSCL